MAQFIKVGTDDGIYLLDIDRIGGVFTNYETNKTVINYKIDGEMEPIYVIPSADEILVRIEKSQVLRQTTYINQK